MPTPQKTLLPLAKEKLQTLLAETGHVLVLDDYEQLSQLNLLALSVVRPTDQEELDILNLPIACGKYLMRQPTLAKMEWLRRCAYEWWEPDLISIATGYVCTLPDSENAIAALHSRDIAEAAVLKFWKSLHIKEEDFYAALERVLPYSGGGDEYEESEGLDGEDICGPTCSLLSREYGGRPDYWLFEAPIGLSRAMTSDYVERMQREEEASRKARGSAKGSHKGGTRRPEAPLPTPKMYAQKRLRRYCDALRGRWQTKRKSSLNLTTA